MYGDLPPGDPPLDLLPPAARFVNQAFAWGWGQVLGDRPHQQRASLVSGTPASPGRYTGRVRVVMGEHEFGKIHADSVMVCPVTQPAWSVVFPSLGAVVTDAGGLLSHPAIIAAYRAAAEEEWMKVRRLGPGDDNEERYGERFRITEVMKALARHDHDVDALVAVLARNLSSSYSFVEIAEVLQEAAEHDRALEWAERGVAAFPEADPRLRDLLAEEYARCARHDDALRVMWAEFTERPYLEAYQKLKSRAERTGSWPEWRAKALALVRERIDGSRRSGRGGRWHDRTDHSGLVRLLLWESNFEAAWHEAQQGGCSGDLWRRLAQQREREHPEDAVAVYRSLLEPALAPKNDAAYAEATALLRRIGDLLQRVGRRGEFADELVAVRAAHRRKRNFMRMLDVL